MRIVLDTNVLVSALLAPSSAPARILSLVFARKVTLCVDTRIFLEYEEVLSRPVFPFKQESVAALLNFIRCEAVTVHGVPSPVSGPDADDMPFVEVCLAGPAVCVVTGNFKHFPPAVRKVVKVMSPREFVEVFPHSGLV